MRIQTVDLDVWKSVAGENEYRLPDSFHARDLIVDIGAHTGSFVKACHERGSREIHAFEPHPENLRLARRNVGALPGVHLYGGAVLEKERSAEVGPFTRVIGKQNTGGVMILNKPGRLKRYAINTLLEHFGYVSLLKLDCEGSEWPILENIKQWHRIGAICGEYHPAAFDAVARLRNILEDRFPFVRIDEPDEEGLGKFWASHIRRFQSDADTGHQARHAEQRR